METDIKPAPAPSSAANPSPTAGTPRPNGPVMDVTPPPAMEEVVHQQPADDMAVSDDIAEQMTEHGEPPLSETAPEHPHAEAPASAEPVSTPPPEDDDTPPPPDAGDSPHELIQDTPQAAPHAEPLATPAAAVQQAPHHSDPTRTAITATVVITIVLSILVVIAYMQSNKA